MPLAHWCRPVSSCFACHSHPPKNTCHQWYQSCYISTDDTTADRFKSDCPSIWIHCARDAGGVLFRWLTAPGGVCELMPGHWWAPHSVFNHYETHAVTPCPWAPSVRKGLTLGQSQRGLLPPGMSVGWNKPEGSGYILCWHSVRSRWDWDD